MLSYMLRVVRVSINLENFVIKIFSWLSQTTKIRNRFYNITIDSG